MRLPLGVKTKMSLMLAALSFVFAAGTAMAEDNVITVPFPPRILEEKHLSAKTLLAILDQLSPKDPQKTYIENTDHMGKFLANSDIIGNAYPLQASQEEINGGARIECQFHGDGKLYNCLLLAEVPREYGFGRSILRLMPKIYQVDVANAGGQPDHDWVMLSYDFTLD